MRISAPLALEVVPENPAADWPGHFGFSDARPNRSRCMRPKFRRSCSCMGINGGPGAGLDHDAVGKWNTNGGAARADVSRSISQTHWRGSDDATAQLKCLLERGPAPRAGWDAIKRIETAHRLPSRVALVGNSRGGYAIRNYVKNGGGAPDVSHAVLCGCSKSWRV